jgi:hypothetical protein
MELKGYTAISGKGTDSMAVTSNIHGGFFLWNQYCNDSVNSSRSFSHIEGNAAVIKSSTDLFSVSVRLVR